MNKKQQDKSAEMIEKLIEYHLGLGSESFREEMEDNLDTDGELQASSERIASVLEPLESYEVGVPKGLYEKILFGIHSRESAKTTDDILKELSSVSVPPVRAVIRRFADFAATAAAILLVVSALLLSSNHARRLARKAICAGNLGIAGSAIASYASDFPNQLPFAKNVSNRQWYDRAKNKPRRPHLFILVRRHYMNPKFLVCPEDTRKTLTTQNLSNLLDFPAGSVVSYSFQNLFGDSQFNPRMRMLRWKHAQNMAIMADKTPLLKKHGLCPELSSEHAISPNHRSSGGQNILTLDGRVIWKKTSIFGPNNDNIFQAGQIQKYRGTEIPASPTDSFLAP